jgi:DNA invertase Pin-like site-specific DNA recombinase
MVDQTSTCSLHGAAVRPGDRGDDNLTSADDRFALRAITAAAAKSSGDTSRRQKRKAAAMRSAGRQPSGTHWFGLPDSYKGVVATAEVLAAEREAIAWGARAHLDGASLLDVARSGTGAWSATSARATAANSASNCARPRPRSGPW